ncbi:MAG TPA: 3-oxoadipate enol-lactonase [Burkholderiaceae bacterium]|jgi:3-oxoadipate enol-lactonase|nr:3-oxoadipate enol-lactonase [Burkholderiaceae bacterium]
MSNPTSLSTRNGAFRVALSGPHDAPVLIFSNSLGTPLEMWEGQAAQFSATHRVVCYDTRGHGGSPVTPGPYTFDMLGDDVLAIMDALGVQRAAFCGVSMGGHTALWLGVHAPDRLTGIAVCNSAARIGTAEGWAERAESVRRNGVEGMKALAASAPERWFTPGFVQANPALVRRTQSWIEDIDPIGYAACCDALGQSDLRPFLGTLGVPALLLAGDSDPVTTVADARAMHEAIPGSKLVSVAASHLSNLEAPEAFNRELAHFLEGLR